MNPEHKSGGSGSLLLPSGCRIAGWIALLAGSILGVIRFHYGIKLHLFDLTVPAIHTSYLEPRYFTVITNHYSEEVAGALVLVGLVGLAFSRAADEGPRVMQVRTRALLAASYLNAFLLLISLLFVFGLGFIDILILNMFSPLVIYLLVFTQQLHRLRRAERAASGGRPSSR